MTPYEQHKKSTGDIGIGRLGDGTEKRDAIHFACAMVQAKSKLVPGGFVELQDGKAVGSGSESAIGVVDPFLIKVVQPGEWFWLILKPGSITDLRHHWTHPAFEEQEVINNKKKSEEWLRNYCDTTEHSYEEFMDMLEYGARSEYGYGFGSDPGVYNVPDEFWQHAETVLGRKLPNHTNSFRCAC